MNNVDGACVLFNVTSKRHNKVIQSNYVGKWFSAVLLRKYISTHFTDFPLVDMIIFKNEATISRRTLRYPNLLLVIDLIFVTEMGIGSLHTSDLVKVYISHIYIML